MKRKAKMLFLKEKLDVDIKEDSRLYIRYNC